MKKNSGTNLIETDRLLLRKFKINDVNDMFEWLGDEDVVKEFTFPVHEDISTTQKILEKWIRSYEVKDYFNWAITLKDSGKVIGNLAAIQINREHDRCEIYYALNRKYWGQGLMTESVKSIVEYLLISAGMNRVEAKCDTLNPASGKVLEKAGMIYEGLLREYEIRKDGKYGDWKIYSLLTSDIH